jgi:hypothetical protein
MTQNGRQKRRQTPESRFYDTLKGEEVRVVVDRDGAPIYATLLWVDRYSIGLRERDRELLLNKRSIRTIGLAKRDRHNGDHSGDTVQ